MYTGFLDVVKISVIFSFLHTSLFIQALLVCNRSACPAINALAQFDKVWDRFVGWGPE